MNERPIIWNTAALQRLARQPIERRTDVRRWAEIKARQGGWTIVFPAHVDEAVEWLRGAAPRITYTKGTNR